MKYILYEGDCLTEMDKISDNSIHLIIVDLPYGTTSCKWDSLIPFKPLWEHYNRILTKNGTVCMFGSEPFATTQRMAQLDLYKYDWIWNKGNGAGFLHAKNMPLKEHEIISIFSKGSMGHKNLLGERRMTYNPQGLIKLGKTKKGQKGRIEREMHKTEGRQTREIEEQHYIQEYTNYPNSILEFKVEGKRVHPTQKPISLYEYLIKTYSNPGETILDNCAGSGTLGVAGQNIGERNIIMIEREPKYIDIIKKRVKQINKTEWIIMEMLRCKCCGEYYYAYEMECIDEILFCPFCGEEDI